jgi:DNA polymerase
LTASSSRVSELARRYLQGVGRLGVKDIVLDMPREEAIRMAAHIGRPSVSDLGDRSSDVATAPAPSTDAGMIRGMEAQEDVAARDLSPATLPMDELSRLAGGATADEIRAVEDLATLRAVVERCTRCPLHETRANAVFGEGDPSARVVCVGEAPGAVEDETGRPFVGRAGKLLDRLLMSIGLPRESVFICNVLKSRPPNNRDPLPSEVEACSPYLLRQLELIDPVVIVAFGAFAARTLLDRKAPLGKLRGTAHRYAGYPLVATYHPAALLRNPGWTRATWEDLQRVRRILDGVETSCEAPATRNASDDSPPMAEPQGGFFG